MGAGSLVLGGEVCLMLFWNWSVTAGGKLFKIVACFILANAFNAGGNLSAEVLGAVSECINQILSVGAQACDEAVNIGSDGLSALR